MTERHVLMYRSRRFTIKEAKTVRKALDFALWAGVRYKEFTKGDRRSIENASAKLTEGIDEAELPSTIEVRGIAKLSMERKNDGN